MINETELEWTPYFWLISLVTQTNDELSASRCDLSTYGDDYLHGVQS